MKLLIGVSQIFVAVSVILLAWNGLDLDFRSCGAVMRRCVDHFNARGHMHCVVIPRGGGRDDTEAIEAAVARCGRGGTVTLPAPYVYTIQKVLHTELYDSTMEVLLLYAFV